MAPVSNPPTKDNFESAYFTNTNAAVKARLIAALRSDSAHIGTFTSATDAIEVIKNALRMVQPRVPNMKTITDPKNVYGATTADAVRTYKSLNGIVRSGQPLDNICGRMTLARLDSELKNMEGGGPVTPPAPGPADTRKPIDLFIQIHGMGQDDHRAGKETEDDVNDNKAFIRKQVETEAYKQQRRLEIINFYGGAKANDPTAAIAKRVSELKAESGPGGKIVILGSSIGGRNAAQLALALQPIFDVTYVALLDAAFRNPQDPVFLAGIKATADSYFEPLSNSWGDVMGNVEFHGAAAGTVGHNVQGAAPGVYAAAAASIEALRQVPKERGIRWATARTADGIFLGVHLQAIRDGNNRAIVKVSSMLQL